jgi:hypothetical protein
MVLNIMPPNLHYMVQIQFTYAGQVLHTLLIYLTVHSEGSTQRGQVFVLMPTILDTLSKCFGLLYMGHKCLRSELFRMDENLAFCDIPAEKLTLG